MFLSILFLIFNLNAGEPSLISIKDMNPGDRTLQVEKEGFIIKIKKENKSKKELKKWLEDQYFLLSSEVKSFRTPYIGDVTKTITCGEKMKVEYQKDVTGSSQGWITYYADQRFVQNTCINQVIVYSALLTVFSCENVGYKIRIFYKNEKDHSQVLSFVKRVTC